MSSVSSILLGLTVGAAGWTLLEYVLHRFVFHGASARGLGAREHRQHHARPDYFAPWWQKALAAVAVTAVVLPTSSAVVGAHGALSSTLGFIAMYLLYEVLHRRAHTHPPRGPYGRWLRRDHFAHHFADPRLAYGVTSPVWDYVFGTRLDIARVRVPRRLAMRWLLDAGGEVREEFSADYEVVGAAHSDERTRQADTEAALANLSPAG